jgi:hypothetical protein
MPSGRAHLLSSDISSLFVNENEKQRFFRCIAFSGHGIYPGAPQDLGSNPPGEIAGLRTDEFQNTLSALRDKNMAFMFLRSCYSGGTNIADIHLPDQTLPCPIYVESSFDLPSSIKTRTPGEEEYDATKVLNEVQKMLFPPRASGAPFETLPRQLSRVDRENLSQVMNYSEAALNFSNLGSLLLPSNARDIPKVAYSLANPEEILDVTRAHQKNKTGLQQEDLVKPLEDQNLNRKGYLFSDPIVPFSLSASGDLPMILLSRGGTMHHVLIEVIAQQQSLEDIAKETFNAFQPFNRKKKTEPAYKVFFIGHLKCRYEGKAATLKRVMIKNAFREREILFQVEGEPNFRKLSFKQ